jgi:hypothetical protein
MLQKVFRKAKHQFVVTWEHHPNDRIKLDFTPIINQFKLTAYQDFLLLHWQNRPRGLRRWGIFCYAPDQYYCTDYDKIQLPNVETKLLQIPELQLRLPPSAVVLFPDCTITQKSNTDLLICSTLPTTTPTTTPS